MFCKDMGTAVPLPPAGMSSPVVRCRSVSSRGVAKYFSHAVPREARQRSGRTVTRLVREGRKVEEIGLTFGLTDLQVKRTLAIGNLLPRIRTMYRADKIDAVTMRHLTLASKAQQREWLTGSNGRAKAEGWLPKWFAFPPSGYTTHGGIGCVEWCERIAPILAPAEVDDEPEMRHAA